jgi:hypothetical protein
MLQLAQPIVTGRGDQQKSARIYWTFLSQMLPWFEREREATGGRQLATLHVVGESHALSAHTLRIPFRGTEMHCAAHWISGCKQWHLGNEHANKYKLKFERVINSLPHRSTILLSIGEIDCRPDEGILAAWQKSPGKSLDDLVGATIEPYLSYVALAAQRYDHELIVQGVPAVYLPPGRELPVETAGQLVSLLCSFNAMLKESALRRDFAFLDVHGLTNRGDGIASGEWHIDYHHLRPSALEQAFRRHCILPGS